MRAKRRAIDTAEHILHGLLLERGPMRAAGLRDLFNSQKFEGRFLGGWFNGGMSLAQVVYCLKLLRARGLVQSDGEHYPFMWSAVAFSRGKLFPPRLSQQAA